LEGRLNDMPLRENFIERVSAYYGWTQMLDKEPSPGGRVKFHAAHLKGLNLHIRSTKSDPETSHMANQKSPR
jgi:hypothetical protein